MKTFILLSAIPGSGKSTWARNYQQLHKNVFIVESDAVRQRLTGSAQCFDKEALVWETFLNDINAYAKKYDEVTVIGDSTNLQNKYRKFYNESTPGFDKHVLVFFNVSYEKCQKQNKMRRKTRIVPDYAMEHLRKELEPVSDEVLALYDEYYEVDNHFTTKRIK